MLEANTNPVAVQQASPAVDQKQLPEHVAVRNAESLKIREALRAVEMNYFNVANSIHCKNMVIFGNDYEQETQRIKPLVLEATDTDEKAIEKLQNRRSQLERLNEIQAVLLRNKKVTLDQELAGNYPDPQLEQVFQNIEQIIEAALAQDPTLESTRESLSNRVTKLLEINEQLMMINGVGEMTLLSAGNMMNEEFSKSLSYDLSDVNLTDQQVADFFVNSAFLKKTMLYSYQDLLVHDEMLNDLLPKNI